MPFRQRFSDALAISTNSIEMSLNSNIAHLTISTISGSGSAAEALKSDIDNTFTAETVSELLNVTVRSLTSNVIAALPLPPSPPFPFPPPLLPSPPLLPYPPFLPQPDVIATETVADDNTYVVLIITILVVCCLLIAVVALVCCLPRNSRRRYKWARMRQQPPPVVVYAESTFYKNM